MTRILKRTELKLIAPSKVFVDYSLYPREKHDEIILKRYKDAIQNKAKFPLIVVAETKDIKGGFVLIDGYHRLTAHKELKTKYLQVEVLKGLTREEMYAEAVKRNTTHGKQFSPFEISKITQRLQELKFSKTEISQIMCIHIKRITTFVTKKVHAIAGAPHKTIPQRLVSKLRTIQTDRVHRISLGGGSEYKYVPNYESTLDNIIELLENKTMPKKQSIRNRLKLIIKLIQKNYK